MTFSEAIIAGVAAIAFTVLLVFLVRVWLTLRRLNASFAKLGHLLREDAKKYFDDAALKIVDTNEQFHDTYQAIVEDATRKVLAESGQITERAIVAAHNQANDIILNARTDAQQIVQAAHKDADDHSVKVLDRTGDAITWVMTNYLQEEFTTTQHEALISKQVKMYVDEHRK
jgi:hypothetical protein